MGLAGGVDSLLDALGTSVTPMFQAKILFLPGTMRDARIAANISVCLHLARTLDTGSPLPKIHT